MKHRATFGRLAAVASIATTAWLAAAPVLSQAPALNQTQSPAQAVTVARATNACFVDAALFTGTLVPREEIFVLPEVDGARIAEVFVEEGDQIKNGQPLAKLVRGPATPGGPPIWSTLAVPVEGLVIKRSARLGAIASFQSPEPLFRLAKGGEIEVEADIPEVRLSKVAAGQVARVQVPGLGEVQGKVRFVSPEIDRQTRLGRVRISIGVNPAFRLGSTVSGTVDTARSCGVSVPVSSLLSRPEGSFVQRVRDGRVETQGVQLGLIDGARAEVKGGLAEGDVVVARAGSFVRDGDAVRAIVPGEAAAAAELRR